MKTKLDELIEKEKNKYIKMIKQKCATCHDKIKNDWKRYKRFGNLCDTCDQGAEDVMKVK